MRRTSVLHVAAGCWAEGGGLSEAVAWLACEQARSGCRVTLAFIDAFPEHPMVARCRAAGVRVKTFRRFLRNPLFLSLGLFAALPELARGADRVHVHGCWTFPVWWAACCARRERVPYVVSPHGSLDPVRRAYGRFRKTAAWGLFDRWVLRGADLLHASSGREAQWLHDALGTACPPIRVVPLGVDGASLDSVPPQPRAKTFLYLGRLHPLKGLDLLAEAWAKAGLGAGWELLVIGPKEGAEVPSVPGLRMLPPCFGDGKARALRSAACLVLPTRSENFGLVVAEALWCRTPVICTRGAPWPELGDFWVETSADALADALRRMAALTPEAREARFAPLFDGARERFSWAVCAAALAEAMPLRPHRYGLAERLRFNLPSLLAWVRSPWARPSLRVLDSEATLRRVLEEGLSLARFGDGEFRVMRGGGIGFQRPDASLRRRLLEIAHAPAPRCLVCLPGVFSGLRRFTPRAAAIWRRILRLQRPWIEQVFGGERVYGDALASRFYLDASDRVAAERILSLWRRMWDGRDLLIVEGRHSRLGVGTDLFANAHGICRILCPARDAWAAYDDILAAALRHAPDRLTLIALGPTATVLAHDLARAGHQALDCGHLDVEYQWQRMGAAEKTPLPGRWVDEAGGLPSEAVPHAALPDVVEDI